MNNFSASFRLCNLLILLVWAGAGCARFDAGDAGEQSISLVLSVKNVQSGQGTATKMTSAITQSGGEFRGIEQLYIIPFNTDNAQVEPEDTRLGSQNVVLATTGISKAGLVPNNNSHYFGSALVPSGMNHVLTYGKSPDEGASKVYKHQYGVLKSTGLSDPSASEDISFHLEPILTYGEPGELTQIENDVDELLDQLNTIMSLMRGSQYASIVSIYDAVKRENQIQACSYAFLNQLRSEIQTALWRIPYESDDLLQEIRLIQTAISALSESLSNLGATFPESYGIPEGSIGFWWNGKEFIRLINSVNIALVNPASYCYPPSLWYYANSTIKTSTSGDVRNAYTPEIGDWSIILDNYYPDGNEVNGFTQAVAIVDKLQYGVALMEFSLKEPGSEASNLISGCPLTGIIIGDQKDVDFRFLPGTGESRFIYDNNVTGLSIGATDQVVHALVLQTELERNVHFALEFKNTTGVTRHCQQGDILPWCKFYLAGELKAPASGSVFTRDQKTIVKVKVDGLQSAYNTVPDLRSPQLEIGVVAEMKWSQLTPQSIVLDF